MVQHMKLLWTNFFMSQNLRFVAGHYIVFLSFNQTI